MGEFIKNLLLSEFVFGALVSVVVWVGLPRMRGDRPDNVNSLYFGFLFTPHARGSTSRACYWP